MPWRISGSARTSTVSNGVPRWSRMVTARLEKPHCGNKAVPFMNSTMSLLFTSSAIRLWAAFWASLTGRLRIRHCRFELQCVKLTPHAPPKRRIDRLVLANAAHSFKAAADHASRIMVAVAGKVADRHFGVGYRRLDQRLDIVRGHRHQMFEASMIWRRASISLFL